MQAKTNKEYAGIAGIKEFVQLSLQFAYGKESVPLAEKRVAGVQVYPIIYVLCPVKV